VNALDFAVLALVLLLTVRGYFRGFFRELAGLAGWLGAGLAAYLGGPVYAPAITARYGLPPAMAQALAALGIFVVIYVASQLLGWILHRLARAVFLGPVDRAGGLVFGAAKAIAISALFCMLVTSRRGLPDFAERVHSSPMLSALAEEGWNAFAVARESLDVRADWQRPYSKLEREARETLNRFLTPKPSGASTPTAAQRKAAPEARP
jgi:membrane protein required for colicin V production